MTTVNVERPGGQDQYGNTLPPTSHTVDNCLVFPAGTGTEQHHQESTVEWDLDLFAPASADIRSIDVITIPGQVDDAGNLVRFQVHGRPARWSVPGWAPGDVFRLQGVEG